MKKIGIIGLLTGLLLSGCEDQDPSAQCFADLHGQDRWGDSWAELACENACHFGFERCIDTVDTNEAACGRGWTECLETCGSEFAKMHTQCTE